MKRPASSQLDHSRSRQKFPEVNFERGEDPFDSFYRSEPRKSPKSFHSLAPYQEVALWDHSSLHQISFDKNLPKSQPTPLLHLLSNYLDTLILNSNPEITPIEEVYLHILNHVYKHKSRVKDNSSSISPIKDQAFTQGIILVLVPSQLHAKSFIEFLISTHCKGNWKKVGKFSRKKYTEIFEENENADTSDAVKLGISLGEKDVNLFTAFKKSDIILGTPLSLKQGISKDDEQFDTGILCSVQIVAVIDCQELLMQNWDHVEDIFKNMNLIPDRDSVANDINRIRDEYLDGTSKNFRQLVLHSQIVTPLVMSLFNRNPNCRGKAKTIEHYPGVVIPVMQKFRKFKANSIKEADDKRFEYFVEYWDRVKEELLPRSVIFVQNYFEFVRIKNYLDENDPGVTCLCEYTPKPDRQRAISLWSSGTCKALCITERLLHFRPLHLKQIGRLVFYSIPIFKDYYNDLVSHSQDCITLFSKYDGFSLQRIVGDAKAEKMTISNSEIFSIN